MMSCHPLPQNWINFLENNGVILSNLFFNNSHMSSWLFGFLLHTPSPIIFQTFSKGLRSRFWGAPHQNHLNSQKIFDSICNVTSSVVLREDWSLNWRGSERFKGMLRIHLWISAFRRIRGPGSSAEIIHHRIILPPSYFTIFFIQTRDKLLPLLRWTYHPPSKHIPLIFKTYLRPLFFCQTACPWAKRRRELWSFLGDQGFCLQEPKQDA